MPIDDKINLLDEVMKKTPQGQKPEETSTLQAMQAAKQPGQVQQLGAALASTAGQEALKRTQGVLQEASDTQGIQAAAQGRESSAASASKELAFRRLAQKNATDIGNLDRQAQAKIYQEDRQFKQDQLGRKYMNQEMLDQYAAEKLVSDQQLNDYVSTSQNLMQRKVQLLSQYEQQLTTVINRGYLKEKQDLDQDSLKALEQMRVEYARQKEKALKKAQGRAQLGGLITTAASVTGAIVGGVLGTAMGPAGTIIGASVGNTVGAQLGTMVASKVV